MTLTQRVRRPRDHRCDGKRSNFPDACASIDKRQNSQLESRRVLVVLWPCCLVCGRAAAVVWMSSHLSAGTALVARMARIPKTKTRQASSVVPNLTIKLNMQELTHVSPWSPTRHRYLRRQEALAMTIIDQLQDSDAAGSAPLSPNSSFNLGPPFHSDILPSCWTSGPLTLPLCVICLSGCLSMCISVLITISILYARLHSVL